jgi:hypothetical protein
LTDLPPRPRRVRGAGEVVARTDRNRQGNDALWLPRSDKARGLRIIQPDIARCGGLTEILTIAALAEVRNVSVIPHCWATDILVSATLHILASQKSAPFLEAVWKSISPDVCL